MKKSVCISFSFEDPNTAEEFEEELKRILLQKLAALFAESPFADPENMA